MPKRTPPPAQGLKRLRPSVRTRFALTVALLLAVPAAQEAAAQAVTTQACQNAWHNAPGRLACTHSGTDVIEFNGQCKITTICPYVQVDGQLQLIPNIKVVSLADTDDLHNCSGQLTVGGC